MKRNHRYQCIKCGGYTVACSREEAARNMRKACQDWSDPHKPRPRVDVPGVQDLDAFMEVQ